MKRLTLVFAIAIIFALGTFTLRSMLTGSPASNPSVSSPAPSVSAATNSARPALPSHSPAARKMGLMENYGRLPLSFQANHGQTDPQVKFLSRGRGYALFLTGNEAVLSLRKPSAFSRDSKLEIRNSKLEVPSQGPSDTGLWPVGLGSLMPNSKSLIPRQSLAPAPLPPAPEVVRLKLVGASPKAKVVGLAELPGKSNYFLGNDPKKWRTNVPNYAKVKYQDVYSGIDLVYYGNQQQLEYDFVVAPGADPRAVQFELVGEGSALPRAAGGRPYHIDANGDLLITTEAGEVRFHKPLVYQPVAAMSSSSAVANPKSQIQDRKSVDGRYVLLADNRIGFDIGAYDKTLPLIIDPVLSYSTYLGGSVSDYGQGIAVDASGNAYVTGVTYSSDFPTTPGAFQTSFTSSSTGWVDAFVAKLNAAGSALVYSTYLAGTGSNFGYGIKVDATGNAYVTGSTSSTDFPTTPGAFQPSLGGGGRAINNAFVTKLNVAGSALVYSTYLGGSDYDYATGIAVDATGNAYVTGVLQSTDFPTTAGAFQTGYRGGGYLEQDAFVTKLNAAGSALVYSTYLSGSSGLNWGTGIAVDATGNAYVTGSTNCSDFPTTPGAFETIWGVSREAFVTKLNAAGSALVYSTYMGGATDTWGLGIAVDASGSAYVTGETLPSDFPTTPGAFQTSLAGTDDAFVAKLNAAGSALVYSTYLGGSGSEFGYGIAVDATGNAYVTGYTSSSDFPTTPGAFPTGITAGGPTEYDAFVTKLNVAGSALVYSTYLGGSNYDYGTGIAVAAAGNTYVAGVTYSSDFPTVNPLQSNCDNCVAATTSDAIVAKISPADVPGVSLTPANLTFAGQTVGLTSSPQIVTLRNVGSAPLSIDRIFANGDFAQTNTCASDILGGGSCTIEVTFTRTATGTRTGSITITDNAAGNPHTVSLTGLETNPLPSLTALSPSSATAGGAAFTLTVNGTNFVSESVVGWNGADRITTYSSSAQLTASIPASDISTGGTAQVTVFNPAPGGGTSNSLNFTINPLGNPVPTLASLVPSSATAGGAAFSLAVYGTNFISGSIVRWGGADRTTTYSSSTQLTASITAADIATGGTVAVTVFNPAPGGGSSNAVTFNINIPDFSLSKDPSSATVTAGQTAEYTLTVTPLGGFNQSVSLSCSGALSAATCSVSPTSVTPDGTNNATATVRITTTARSIAPPSLPLGPPSLGLRLPTLLFLMLITVMLLAIAAGRQRARFRLIVALAALVLVSALVACGGGGNGGGGFTPPAGTLAGTYTLTITATSGSLSHNTTVSLTVN